MKIVDVKDNHHDKDILGVLSLSMYMPAEETLNLRAENMRSMNILLRLPVLMEKSSLM